MPSSWNLDLLPPPDATEYAITARNLARDGSYSISLLGVPYPPARTFGFPLLLAPIHWLPGARLVDAIWVV